MKKLWTVLALTTSICAPAAAGVVYEIEVTDHEQSPPKTESMETAVEGRNLKMGVASQAGGQQGEMIFRGDRREIVVVDREDKSYFVMDQEQMKAIGEQVGGAMAQMQKALEGVPEDKRRMMEEMMKRNMPQAAAPAPAIKTELRKTGEKAEKNGYPCVKYDVFRGGTKVREMWVTEWSNVEGGPEVAGTFEELADFMREMLDSIPDFGGMGAAERDDIMFEHMKELGGFPVVTRDFGDDGSLEGETTLRSARRQTLDPDAFEPPAGYKRRTMLGGQ